MEKAINQQKNIDTDRLISLINNMSDAVIATDSNFIVTHYNASALNLLDRNTSIAKNTLSDVMKIVDIDDEPVNLKTLIKSIKVSLTSDEFKLLYVDKSTINLYLSITPLHLGFGKEDGGFIITFRDITQEKSLDNERDEFISVVSHELRNPIAIAEGSLSNALYSIDKKIPIDQLKTEIDRSHKQIIFLSELINDLTSLSRAENNKKPDILDKINASELIQELANEYIDKANNKKLKLLTNPDPNLEIICSSRLYVKEILQNFISNAIKYTESGNIEISAKHSPIGIEFTVSDTGIGISKADSLKIFNKFFRSGDYRTSQSSGTGLGLYIAIKLAKIISAQISFESALNHGSTFRLNVPNQKQ